jgi:hypothetical protein
LSDSNKCGIILLMNIVEARQQMSEMERIDLTAYGDLSLSGAGELQVAHYFRQNILLELGADVLELSKIAVPGNNEANLPVGVPRNAYILRNLSDDSGEGSILFGDELQTVETLEPEGRPQLRLMGRQHITVGRAEHATPQLRLSRSVSHEHMHIRLGNMVGNVHFADLDSKNGTNVYLDSHDAKFIGRPSRVFVRTQPDVIVLREELKQRWSR